MSQREAVRASWPEGAPPVCQICGVTDSWDTAWVVGIEPAAKTADRLLVLCEPCGRIEQFRLRMSVIPLCGHPVWGVRDEWVDWLVLELQRALAAAYGKGHGHVTPSAAGMERARAGASLNGHGVASLPVTVHPGPSRNSLEVSSADNLSDTDRDLR